MQDLNQKQSEFLAQFFFDISKGLTLGSVGFYVIPTSDFTILTKILHSFSGILIAVLFVRLGLLLLDKWK